MWRGVIGYIVVAVLVSGDGWADDQAAVKEAQTRVLVPGTGVINDIGEPIPGVTPGVGRARDYLIDDMKGGDRAVATRRYSLGLHITEISDALRTERKLPKDKGVLVIDVVPGTPAAKAGFKSQDVIVKTGKKSIRNPMDLVKAVQESKGKTLTLEVLRDGTSQTITVTPAKGAAGLEETPEGTGQDQAAILRGVKPPVLQWFTQPGAPWRWQMRRGPTPTLPDDMTVTITKTGKKPAQIVVKQGKQQWEAGENELAKLPEAARSYVEQLLAQGSVAVLTIPPPPNAPFGRQFGSPTAPQTASPYNPAQFPQLEPMNAALQKQLDEINKRMDKLQDAIKALQKAQPHSKP